VTLDERYALWRHYRGEEEARRATAGSADNMVMLVLTPERWMTYG